MIGDMIGWLIDTGRLTGSRGNGLKAWIDATEDGLFSLPGGLENVTGEGALAVSLGKDSTMGLASEEGRGWGTEGWVEVTVGEGTGLLFHPKFALMGEGAVAFDATDACLE